MKKKTRRKIRNPINKDYFYNRLADLLFEGNAVEFSSLVNFYKIKGENKCKGRCNSQTRVIRVFIYFKLDYLKTFFYSLLILNETL